MSKQTAVEWLEEKLKENLKHIILNGDYVLMESIFLQAKAMGREQTEQMITRVTLNDFYNDLTLLMQKYELTMDCWDEYNEDGWCGQQFTLRSKEPVDGKYMVYVEDIGDFVEGFWNAQRKKGGEQ